MDTNLVGGEKTLPEAPAVQIGRNKRFMRRLRRHRIVAPFLGEYEADVFRRLRTIVLQRLSERNAKTLGICSAGEGEGKSLIALNLAISLSLDVNQRILLVELDFRRPYLWNVLASPPAKGLDDVLKQQATIAECLVDFGFERLTLLPARSTLPNSSELIASPYMAQIVAELRNRYPDRLIVCDVPPLLLSDDALAFMEHLDAFLMVVGSGKATLDDLDRALSFADQRKLIGTVLNGSRDGFKKPKYYDENH